ncbi:MAG TPA: arginase family protein [Chitinophagales bacterium]|jgi:formiminoglutamase|nr:arginase family protein [Chitinophagales bacterium]MBP6154697.1 arginase family protein [Chitinophagales bacterium]HQV78585.1 arginase family protein [Chitinophagales bacterium]HQW79029.1 arginase family protein [Chitinophagales bacterium]HRB68011.1 arginase family protein [Chitinophagales bacterium]
MLSDFLQPIDPQFLHEFYFPNKEVTEYIHLYQQKHTFENYSVALLGVEDYRGYIDNKGTEHAANAVRKQLYQYAAFTNGIKLLDVGNIKAGETYVDTLVALVETLQELFKHNIITIIIGGDAALASAQFKAHEIFENPLTVTQVAAKVIWDDSDMDIHKTYLKDFFLSGFLKQYNLVAYQSYLMQEKQLSFLSSKEHNVLRVGKIREHIFEAEPYLREASMVMYNINAIRHSDAPAQPEPSPNGMFGDEACGVARYAGMSDQLMSMGIFDFNPSLDVQAITAKQVAQMVWYFMEGVSLRRNDYPITDEKDFSQYIVQIDDAENDFIFLKSKKSDRWWMKIMYDKFDIQKHKLIPCTYKDYLTALNNEIPERWMREWIRVS